MTARPLSDNIIIILSIFIRPWLRPSKSLTRQVDARFDGDNPRWFLNLNILFGERTAALESCYNHRSVPTVSLNPIDRTVFECSYTNAG